jgi:hypothetical protein
MVLGPGVQLLGCLVARPTSHARSLGAADVGFDDDVVRAADEQQVLRVVTPEQNEPALPVQLVDVDDPEARLAVAIALGHGSSGGRARRGQPPKHEGKAREQDEDDRERDDVLHGRGGFRPENRGEQDPFPREGAPLS